MAAMVARERMANAEAREAAEEALLGIQTLLVEDQGRPGEMAEVGRVAPMAEMLETPTSPLPKTTWTHLSLWNG